VDSAPARAHQVGGWAWRRKKRREKKKKISNCAFVCLPQIVLKVISCEHVSKMCAEVISLRRNNFPLTKAEQLFGVS